MINACSNAFIIIILHNGVLYVTYNTHYCGKLSLRPCIHMAVGWHNAACSCLKEVWKKPVCNDSGACSFQSACVRRWNWCTIQCKPITTQIAVIMLGTHTTSFNQWARAVPLLPVTCCNYGTIVRLDTFFT